MLLICSDYIELYTCTLHQHKFACTESTFGMQQCEHALIKTCLDDEEFSDLFGAQKREAWLRLRGRGKEQTMKGYISYVEELGNKYGWMLDGEKIGESLFDESLLQSAF